MTVAGAPPSAARLSYGAAPLSVAGADGRAEIGFACRDGVTRLAHLYQRTPLRVMFPRSAAGDPPTAVLVTTSGGLVAGDRMAIDIEVAAEAEAVVTTQAAEKVYRSTGADCRIDVALRAGAGSWLEYMPQETILFQSARLRRRTRIDRATGARVMAGEITVFGRKAHGEVVSEGFLRDAWEVRRDGYLVWADALRLAGDLAESLAAPAGFDGAIAVATFVYAADDAPARLDLARRLVDDPRAGATCIGDVLIARWLDRDASRLRAAYGEFWSAFRAEVAGRPRRTPRVWQM